MADSGKETPAPAGTPEPSSPSEDRSTHPYEVIARRYRPRRFHEVVGQEAIAETLSQAIQQGRLGHAYLFCGPRGVGKTSMARIFARALQCPNAKDGEPCDACGVCERIFRGEDMDVVEMDGASHRGIDDVRELIQHVRYAPTDGRYRIFIIDEVHMLTREAFNSLLKTLEEPPAHVKFFFATTEPEKVLATVLSRCQRFDFSPISPSDIVRRLAQICEAEGATPEDGLLDRIASLSRGGMRDSQSQLDQLLSFSGSNPTLAELDRITGRLSPEAVDELLALVEAGERARVVTELEAINRGGTDPSVLLEQVIEALRERLHSGVASGWGEVEIDRNLLAQEILQEARARIRRLGRADIVLELALLRLSTLVDLAPISRWSGFLSDGAPPPAAAAAPQVRAVDRGSAVDRGRSAPPRRERGEAEPTAPPPRTSAESPRSTSPPPAGASSPAEPAASTPESSAQASPSAPSAAPAPAQEPEPEGGIGIAALRAAVESPVRAPARATSTASFFGKDTDEEPPVDASDPREAVREALNRVSGSVQRVVGDRFTIDRGDARSSLLLPERALSMLGDRCDALRRELVRAFGGAVQIEAGEFAEAAPAAPELTAEPAGPIAASPAPGSPPEEIEVPEIVEKAKEIFRGELFRGGPPRR